jgi:hypothetical protein
MKPVRSFLMLFAPGLAAIILVGASPAAFTGTARRGDLHVRPFPLQHEGDRAIVWLEVTGEEAARVSAGADKARLILDGEQYRPIRALVRQEEGPDRTLRLDRLSVERTPGAIYLRFEFRSIPQDYRRAEFSWSWHRREPGEPVHWDVPGIERRVQSLDAVRSQGFRVTVPEFGWQERGPIRLEGTSVTGTAGRTAWFHLVVHPDRTRSDRFPAGFVDYELTLRTTGGRTLEPVSVDGRRTIGLATDVQHTLAQFSVSPGESGILEWVPIFSRDTGREFRVELPDDRR